MNTGRTHSEEEVHDLCEQGDYVVNTQDTTNSSWLLCLLYAFVPANFRDGLY